MKKKVEKILNLNKELSNCNNLIFEKENDILSCVKSIGQEGIRMRQKEAAVSLLELKEKKENLENQLKELCKGLDLISFNRKKVMSGLTAGCINSGIKKEELRNLKQIFQTL